MEGAKKSKTSIYIIVIAILLIVAGVVLIMTGNNKSFIEKKDTKKPAEEEKKEEEPKDEDIPDRILDPYYIDEEIVLDLIVEKKNNEFPGENWSVQNVNLIGHDEEGEKILVSYDEVHEDSSTVLKQTIVSILNGEKSVELPGWIEGERDLTVYNFIPYEKLDKNTDMKMIDFSSEIE